jgi:hypothetical protein
MTALWHWTQNESPTLATVPADPDAAPSLLDEPQPYSKKARNKAYNIMILNFV